MNRNHLWKLLFVVLLVVWSIYEIYPPNNQDLIQYFSKRAVRQDAALKDVLARAQELRQAGTGSQKHRFISLPENILQGKRVAD
mgnify:CR=1 FL=1